jgi:hypothetical protein
MVSINTSEIMGIHVERREPGAEYCSRFTRWALNFAMAAQEKDHWMCTSSNQYGAVKNAPDGREAAFSV